MPGQAVIGIRNREWQVALATSPWEQAKGLGGIPSIPAGTGMLFDLGYDQVIAVTTVPMLFPLDIAFISDSLMVVDVGRDVPPGLVVSSSVPARFFLEVNANELEGIGTGDSVYIQLLAGTAPQQIPDWVTAMFSFMGFALAGMFMVAIARMFITAALAEPEKKPILYGPKGEKLLPQTKSELKEEWYEKGIKAGKTDGWMAVEDTLSETLRDHRDVVKNYEDLVWTDVDLWEQTEHFNAFYGSKMWEDTLEATSRDIERAIDIYSDLRDEFWEGYLTGRKKIGIDIYKKAKELFGASVELIPQTKGRRGRVARAPKLGERYIFEPVAMDRWEPIVIKGKVIAAGSSVTVTKTDIDPRGLFVWIRNDEGNEMSVFRSSLKAVSSPRETERSQIKLAKPTRYEVTVESWQERERLGIWITDNRTGQVVVEWWDDEAREMFEQGFFKPGVPQYSWEKPGQEFVDSVLDYTESHGLLAKASSPGTTSLYLPQTSTATKLNGLQIVRAHKQISRHGADKISVSLEAWAIFPRGKKAHLISMYRSGDKYIISPLYAHIREWVEVPMDKVRAWIKTLPVRHFEPSAVAPQYREEAERLAKEVDSPMDIIPLPSRKGASTYTPGEIAEYKGERVRVREHIGDRVQILIPSRQEEVWVEEGKLKKLELLPQTQTYEKMAYELLEDSDFWFDVYRVKDLTGLSYEEASKVMAILANKEFLAKARAFYEGFRYPSRSAQIALQNIKAIETEQFAQTSPERHLGKPKSEVEKKTGCKPEAIPEREFDDWIKNTTEAVKEGHSPHSCLIDLFKEFGLLKEFDWMWQWGYFDEWTKHPTQKGLRELFDMAVRRYEAEHSQETGLVRKKSHYYASTEEERAEPSMADKVRQLGFNPEEFWALCEKIDEAMLGENGVMWLPAGERRQELEEKVYPLLREFEQKYGFNCPISVTGVDVFQLGMRIDNALRQRREATSKTKSLTVMPTKKKKGSSSTLEYFADSSEFLTQTVDSIGYREKIDKTFQEAIARAKGLKQWQ